MSKNERITRFEDGWMILKPKAGREQKKREKPKKLHPPARNRTRLNCAARLTKTPRVLLPTHYQVGYLGLIERKELAAYMVPVQVDPLLER